MPRTVGNPGGLWDALTGSSAENRTRALIHGPLASIAPDPFLDGLYPEERRLAPLDFSMGAGGNGYQGLRDAGQGTSANWGGNNSRGAGYRVGDNQRLVDGPTANGTSSAANQNGNSGLDAYLNSVGYQFERDQGLESVNRSAAARGGALSGRALMESQQYGQGLASQRAGDYMNRLASLAGAGQTATSGVNTLGYNTGQGIANNLNSAGNARASGYINQANAYGNMFNNLGQMGAYYFGNNGGGS